MKQIATALVKAQKAFQPALKTSLNPHFRSKYADLSACVEAVIDALNANGIFLLQKNYDCPDGVMVETVFVHESGEMLECGIVHFPASKKDSQGYASALTYARRYSLMSACGIAPEDDDGNAASKSVPRITPTRSDAEISDKRQSVIADVAEAIKERMAADDVVGAFDEANGIIDADEKVALWTLLDSKTRSAIKKQAELLKETK
jgi:hypothetical protein